MSNKELRIKFVDDLRIDYQVKAQTVTPEEIEKREFNRAKKKTETRRMTKDYLGR